jgi:LysM repeat protein
MQQTRRSFVSFRIALVISLIWLGWPQLLFAAPVAQTGDPVVIAAGDIANCSNVEDWETAYLLDGLEGTVLVLGDNAYEVGSIEEYNACYEPTWGRHKARTRPVPGNHEYGTDGAAGYYTYFGDRATPLEPGCTKGCKGYYSFDVGAWHLIALNGEIDNNPGSEQEQWLRADLAAHPTTCTLAYWHRPRFSSGRHGNGAGDALWRALYDYGADVVLVGHDHDYERFAPQDANGQLAPDRGIRQFVVGTGGAPLRDFVFIQPNSEARNSETFGVLKLVLHPTSYDWEFIPIPRQTFRDAGSAPCVTAGSVPPPPANLVITPTIAAPVVVNATAPAPTLSQVSAPAPAPTPAPVAPADSGSYTVRAGDTLFAIGLRFAVDWRQIAVANGLTENSIIQIGQLLRIPGAASGAITNTTLSPITIAPTITTTGVVTNTRPLVAPTPTPRATFSILPTRPLAPTTAATRFHTVVSGDTIIGIALRYGIDWRTLLQLNGLSETSIIQVGQRIRLD